MGSIPKKPWTSHTRPEPVKPAATAQPVDRLPDTLNPYQRGDPIPKPEAIELDNDSTWAEFSNLAATENRRFADTAPASRPMLDSGFPPTTQAPLQNLLARPAAPVRRALSVVEVMVEARKNNRVCPKPAKWQQLYEMLPDRRHSEPAPPLVGAAWTNTTPIPKRMCFREHIEWAASHGYLQQIYTFMQGLPESDWYHMGDKALFAERTGPG